MHDNLSLPLTPSHIFFFHPNQPPRLQFPMGDLLGVSWGGHTDGLSLLLGFYYQIIPPPTFSMKAGGEIGTCIFSLMEVKATGGENVKMPTTSD